MTVAARPRLQPPALSARRLMDAPLAELLDELGVELVDSPVTDAGYFGAFVEHCDGSRALSMPPGRSVFERDTAARMLLAQGLGLEAPAVPEALKVAVL